MTSTKSSLESLSSFSDLQALLNERSTMNVDEAARRQPEFELKLREQMRRVECDIHKSDFERMDVEVAGVVANNKRFRFKKN